MQSPHTLLSETSDQGRYEDRRNKLIFWSAGECSDTSIHPNSRPAQLDTRLGNRMRQGICGTHIKNMGDILERKGPHILSQACIGHYTKWLVERRRV